MSEPTQEPTQEDYYQFQVTMMAVIQSVMWRCFLWGLGCGALAATIVWRVLQ